MSGVLATAHEKREDLHIVHLLALLLMKTRCHVEWWPVAHDASNIRKTPLFFAKKHLLNYIR
jgi:hypothetical protein